MNRPTGRYSVVTDDRSTELHVSGLRMIPGTLRDGSPCEFVPRRLIVDTTAADGATTTLRVQATSSDRVGRCSWEGGPAAAASTLADMPPAIRALVLAARPDLAADL